MKTLFFKKNILFLICFFVIFLAFAHSTSAARPNNKERTMRLKKVVVLDSKCVENNGKCIEESKAKDLVKVISTESLCSEGKVCVKNTTPAKTDLKPATKDSKAVIDEKKTPIVPAANDTSTIPKEVSEFCKTNPTRAQINDGTAKKNGFDGSAMSQEECQVWVYGSADQFQKEVANDPDVNKGYVNILNDMKGKMTDPGLLENITKTIADVEKTITIQSSAIQSTMSNVLAPASNLGQFKNAFPIENPPSSDKINLSADYKAECKKNNNLPVEADTTLIYPKVVYEGNQRCPAGYVENGLQYSTLLEMRCCIKDEVMFKSCTSGDVKYSSECYDGKTTAQYSVFSGGDRWVCCPNTAIETKTLIKATSQIVDKGAGVTLRTTYEELCMSKSGVKVDGQTCQTGFVPVPGIGYNKNFNISCCKKSS